MAYGNKLMFVLTREQVRAYIDPDLTAEQLEELADYGDDELINCLLPGLDSRLAEVHERLVRGHLDAHAARDARGRLMVNVGNTVTELSSFHMDAGGDEDGPVTFGISLITRYFPVWVDWRSPHGGSHGPIVLDEETMNMVAIARSGIAEVVPEVAQAPLAVVPCHF